MSSLRGKPDTEQMWIGSPEHTKTNKRFYFISKSSGETKMLQTYRFWIDLALNIEYISTQREIGWKYIWCNRAITTINQAFMLSWYGHTIVCVILDKDFMEAKIFGHWMLDIWTSLDIGIFSLNNLNIQSTYKFFFQLNIQQFKCFARFGLMHIVATNICVWIRTVFKVNIT